MITWGMFGLDFRLDKKIKVHVHTFEIADLCFWLDYLTVE